MKPSIFLLSVSKAIQNYTYKRPYIRKEQCFFKKVIENFAYIDIVYIFVAANKQITFIKK